MWSNPIHLDRVFLLGALSFVLFGRETDPYDTTSARRTLHIARLFRLEFEMVVMSHAMKSARARTSGVRENWDTEGSRILQPLTSS